MAYNEFLGERISNGLRKRGIQFEEKRMFGGMAFMVITILLMDSACLAQDGFRESQQRYPRVRQAYSEKWDLLEELMAVTRSDNPKPHPFDARL